MDIIDRVRSPSKEVPPVWHDRWLGNLLGEGEESMIGSYPNYAMGYDEILTREREPHY